MKFNNQSKAISSKAFYGQPESDDDDNSTQEGLEQAKEFIG